jgi:2',3'-cyclic-nucleotide 2'-phosphodiesterase (5'-nucleotidase family)
MAMLNVLCTNDFCGIWNPLPTSYGHLPGGAGLVRTIERLKSVCPSVWVDAGDLVIGPLAIASGSKAAFEAAGGLPLDFAVPGNHEFDWGLDQYRNNAGRLPFPSLCGNVDVGLPATMLMKTAAGPLGVIGLTCPGLAAIHFVRNSIVGRVLDEAVTRWAGELRERGARWIVLVLHDGVDFIPSPQGQMSNFGAPGLNVDVSRLHGIVKKWLPHIDGLVCGHTLIRWFGELEGVPVAQPMVYGAEVGVIALRADGPGVAYGVPVEPAGAWQGPGSTLVERLNANCIGSLSHPLAMHANAPSPLLDAVGRSALAVTDADAAFITIWDVAVRQPLVGGVMAYWPAGPFTELDLLSSFCPPDDTIALVELTATELTGLPALSSLPYMVANGVIYHPGVPHADTQPLRVAVCTSLVDRVAAWIGRPLARRATSAKLRQAVAEDIASGRFGCTKQV